jgi:hypothetical protein
MQAKPLGSIKIFIKNLVLVLKTGLLLFWNVAWNFRKFYKIGLKQFEPNMQKL